MKEGGRRQLVISSEDLFGDNLPEGVEAGEMIVMVVDLVSADAEDPELAGGP